MRRVAVFVVAAGCSFDGGSGLPADAPPGTPDSPAITIDAAVIDSPPIDARPDARVDASPPDAGYSVTLCPVDYTLTSATSPNSRYRVIGAGTVFATHHADCNDDHPGWTHLVTFGSQQEAQNAADFLATTLFYVGAVQQPGQGAPGSGWAWFDGSMTLTAWDTATGQPNDSDDSVENGEQDLMVATGGAGLLQDVSGTFTYTAVCECDGIAIDPTVATWIPEP